MAISYRKSAWFWSKASIWVKWSLVRKHLIFFIYEFGSNASDALDKLRFLSVTEPELIKDAVDFDIRIQSDKDNGIITIT